MSDTTTPPSTRTALLPGASPSLDFWGEALEHLQAGRADGMLRVTQGFRDLRATMPRETWRAFTRALRDTPLHAALHQDPFTSRAFLKPRGYAGDAVMMDMIYGGFVPDAVTELGAVVFSYTSSVGPASVSVRERRDSLARYLDDAADAYDHPDVLAVACGHLREAQRSRALAAGRLGRFVAVDQDDRSLRVVEAEQAHFGVAAVRASVRQVLAGRAPLARYDVIYTAGLFDYLERPVATALTRTLFGLLKPGGQLLIANFAPELVNVGYMEAVMDWWLVYREENEMDQLTAGIPANQIAAARIWRDAPRNVVYLEVRRH